LASKRGDHFANASVFTFGKVLRGGQNVVVDGERSAHGTL